MAIKDKREEKQEEEKPMSKERANFLQLIENYKKQNPVKYERKKEELERKLAAIK